MAGIKSVPVERGYKEVVRLFRNETKEWYHIHVNGEEIVCTAGHSFYVVGKGFVSAKLLKISDKLLRSDGKEDIIEAIEIEELEKPETTYNFEVADFHTYYVTESNILVHNDCISDELTRIANKYNDFECVECADEMKAVFSIVTAKVVVTKLILKLAQSIMRQSMQILRRNVWAKEI